MAVQKPIVMENATNDLSVIIAGDYIDPTSLASGTPSNTTFLRGDNVWSSSPLNKTGDTMTGQLFIAPTIGAIAQSAGSLAKLQVTSNGTASDAAFMQFHRVGSFATYFGLDTDNFFKVGGWSTGAVSYKLFHEGYFPSSAVTTALGFTPYNASNPAGYITAASAPVQSVAGRTGAVVLANTDISGLGTMSTQNAVAIAVTGGTINGASIGSTTPAAGSFTTLAVSTGAALAQNAILANGGADTFFKLTAANGVASNAVGSEVSSFGIRYNSTTTLGTGFSFIRGGGSADICFDFWSGSIVQGRLASNGNWLLGTTTDDGVTKLQVNGSAKIGGNLTVSSGNLTIATLGSSSVPTSYVTFLKGGTSTAIAYLGSDGGAALSGGVGNNFALQTIGNFSIAANGLLHTFSSTGLAIAGNISASAGSFAGLSLTNGITFNNANAIGWGDFTTYIQGSSATGLLNFIAAGGSRAQITSTGLAVTGALSATGLLDISTTAASGANVTLATLRQNYAGTAGHEGFLNFTNISNTSIGKIGTRAVDGTNASFVIRNFVSGALADAAVFSPTGLAVTGVLSSYQAGLYDSTTKRYLDVSGDFSGTNAATQANAGALTGIRMGNVSNPGKWAMISAVSEDTLGYSRTTALAFYSAVQDTAAAERGRFSGRGALLLNTITDDGSNTLQVNGHIAVKAGNAVRFYNPSNNAFATLALDASNNFNINYPIVAAAAVTVLGGLTAASFTSQFGSGNGSVTLRNGNSTNTGYIEFVAANAVRQGYIGFSSTGAADAGTTNYVAGVHAFNGAITVSTGSSSIRGLTLVGAAGTQGSMKFGSANDLYKISGGADYLGVVYDTDPSYSHQLRVGSITIGTFSATGLAVAGVISASSTTSNNTLTLSNSTAGSYLQLQSNGYDGYINMPSTGAIHMRLGASNTDIARFSSSGLDVTGVISASGLIKTFSQFEVATNNSSLNTVYIKGGYNISNYGARIGFEGTATQVTEANIVFEQYIGGVATERARFNAGGLNVTGAIFAASANSTGSGTFVYGNQQTYPPSNFGGTIVGWNKTGGGGETNIVNSAGAGGAPGISLQGWDGTTLTTFAKASSTGLAVTGTISATGNISSTTANLAIGDGGSTTQVNQIASNGNALYLYGNTYYSAGYKYASAGAAGVLNFDKTSGIWAIQVAAAGAIGAATTLNTIASFNSTGLAVTGSVTTTGTFSSRGITDNAAATAITLDASGNLALGVVGTQTYTGASKVLNIRAPAGANATVAQVISGNADAWITLYSGLNVTDGAAIIRPFGSTLRFARATSSAGTANFIADVIISGGGRLLVGTSSDDGVNQVQVAGSVIANTLISNIATGTAPFTVTSTTPVVNLSIGGTAANVTGIVAIANGGTAGTTASAANNNIVNWGQLTPHVTYQDFNLVQKWGATYVQSTGNSPNIPGATQYYQTTQSLGSDYNWGTANVYAMQTAIPRTPSGGLPYLSVRYKEGGGDTGGWGAWSKIYAGYADSAGTATTANSSNSSTGSNLTGTNLSIGGTKLLDTQNNSPSVGPYNPLWASVRGSGRSMFPDEEFAYGTNGVQVYNNAGGTGVVHTREADANAPNATRLHIKIVTDGVGATSPGLGGFIQSITARVNATFIQIFRAKIPAGYTLVIAENAQGLNNTSYWMTNSVGTGKWEDYARVSHCGDSGTFSIGGHVYLSGPAGAVTWYLASCNLIDVTAVDYAPYSVNNFNSLVLRDAAGGFETGTILVKNDNYLDFGPNSTWASTLRVGGNGWASGGGTTRASVVTTNGNLHLDSGSDKAIFLNFYSGAGGINFGNGASAVVASVNAAGVFNGTNFAGPGTGLTGTAAGLNVGGTASALTNFQVFNARNDTIDLNSIVGTNSIRALGSANPAAPNSYGTILQINNSDVNTQLYMSYNAGLYYRANASSTLAGIPWRYILDTTNYNNYSPTLTGGNASGNWAINVTGTASSISGYNNPVTAATANTIAYRDGNGDLTVRELVMGSAVHDEVAPASIMGVYPNCNQVVKFTAAKTAAFLSGQAMNIAGSANTLTSTHSIAQYGSTGTWNADFQNTPAGTMRHGGDLGAVATNNPGGSWWMQQNFRHTNGSNYWGTQVAWGWEDNANKLATRNITGGTFGAWVYYLNSVNYNNYSPTLIGVGAYGNWNINSLQVTSSDGDRLASTKLPTTSPQSVRFDFVGGGEGGSPGSNYAGLMTYAPWTGTTASTGDASYQISFGSTATNGSGQPRLKIRNGIDSTWNTWYDILTSSNTKTINGISILGSGDIPAPTTVDGTNLIGYRGIPQNSQSAAYTLVLTDAGKHILHPSADTAAKTYTIPANASVAFPIGTTVTFVNQASAGVLTIAITTDVMRLAGVGTTGSRALAANGIATALKITATEWIISGAGLT